MPNLNSFLLGILAVTCALIIGAGIWIYIDEAAITKKNDTINVLTIANSAFKSSVDTQNAAIAAWQAKAQAASETAAKAVADAARKSRSFDDMAKKIQAVKLNGDACKAADGLFNLYLGR